MLSFLRKSLLTALLAPVALIAAPASASTTYVVGLQGTGIVTPGVTLTPTLQRVAFTVDFATAVGANGDTIVATGCRFEGASSSPETLITGAGSGTLASCVGAAVTGNVLYTRTLGVITLTGTITVNGSTHTLGANALQVIPTSAEPTTTYAIAGSLLLV